MKRHIAKLAGVIALFSANSVYGITVKTCTLDYSGVVNAVVVDGGQVTGIAKLFAKESEGDDPYTLVSKDGKERQWHGTVTTTIDLSAFASSGSGCSFDNRFTPIHSISEKSPWRQFQMRFDSYYDSNIMANYDYNGIETKLMVANGWTWGTEMASIHVFEMRNGEFFPVKYDVDQGNGELPAYKAGNHTMSLDGDGGQWQYRASAVSDDGRLIAGYAKLEGNVRFDRGSRINNTEKFGFVWEINESCRVDSSKCNNADASRLTTGSADSSNIQVRSLSAQQISRNSNEKARITNGSNVTLDRSGLQDGQVISYSSIPTDFTIGYQFSKGQENVECTLIDAEGALEQNKLERIDPYVIYGDSNNGSDYNTRNKSTFGEGELTLTIRAFGNRDCEGEHYYTDTITVNINKTDNTESAGVAGDTSGDTAGEFYLVDRQESVNNFEMLNFDKNSTMESVFGVTTIRSGRYLVNGRAASGKAMVALVTL